MNAPGFRTLPRLARLVMFAAATLVYVSFQSSAQQSQPPAQSFGETSSPQKPISATNQKNSTDDERGTQESPLIVKVLDPPNSDAKVSQDEADRKARSKSEWWNWVFSGGLVLVGIGEAVVFFYTALVTNKAANAAKLAAEHIPTVARAYFFGGLTDITIDAGRTKTTLKITVDNPGRTPGVLRSVYGQFSLSPPKGDIPTYEHGARYEMPLVINSSNGLNPTEPANRIVLPVIFNSDFTDPHYFWGYFEYVDIFNKLHMSRFCTIIFPAVGKFDVAGSPAWNG